MDSLHTRCSKIHPNVSIFISTKIKCSSLVTKICRSFKIRPTGRVRSPGKVEWWFLKGQSVRSRRKCYRYPALIGHAPHRNGMEIIEQRETNVAVVFDSSMKVCTSIQSLLAFRGPSIDTMARPRYYLAANYSRDSWLWKRTLSSSRPRKRMISLCPNSSPFKKSFLNCCPRGYLNQFARLPKYNWIIFFSHKYSSGLCVLLTLRMYLFRLFTLYRVHTFYVLVQLLTIEQERIAHPVKERKEEFGIVAGIQYLSNQLHWLKCALIVKCFLKCKLLLHCDCSI